MINRPPSWADRFLSWYCNPDLLEEIQGDAHELYFERLRKEGKKSADFKYVWDVLRFCRWSNIKREGEYVPGSLGGRWNLNLKMSIRNAQKNKLIFCVKTFGLSICLAFALLLAGFMVNETTFDMSHANHERIFRVTSVVNFKDHIVDYAVVPLPIGQAFVNDVPEVECYTRLMYEEKPTLSVDEEIYYEETVFSADSNFFKLFTFDIVSGDPNPLSGPDKIVLTESLASKFFGGEDAVGKTIGLGDNLALEVTAVIRDVPANSHLKFDALISWETIDREDGWENLNSYTYILLKPGASIDAVREKTPSMMEAYHELIVRDYDGTFETVFENIADIHFSSPLNEDVAQKGNSSYLYILMAVVGLFMMTGLINYLNLTLAELTTYAKRIGILKVFGGLSEGTGKIIFVDVLITLLFVVPLAVLFVLSGSWLGAKYLSININDHVFLSPIVAGLFAGFLFLLLISTWLNAMVVPRAGHFFNGVKTKVRTAFPIRKMLVATQLSFSLIMIALIVIIVDQFNFIRESDKGFEAGNVIMVKVRSYDYQSVKTFSDELKRIGGVEEVAGSSYYPGVIETKYVFEIETKNGREQRLIPMMNCTYEYLNLLEVKMNRGRGFDPDHVQDQASSFIVNEAAAREFGWKDAIGKKIDGPVTGSNESYRQGEVIGVARDFNFASLHEKIEPMIVFLSDENWAANTIYIKTDAFRSREIIGRIEDTFRSQWEDLPFDWEYLDTKYMNLYAKDYELKSIFQVGLIISILTSAMGIFSISALLITVRAKEMGIRKISGANPMQLLLIHSKTFIQFLVLAMVVSFPFIWYLSGKWLQSFVYHIDLNGWHFVIPTAIAFVITIATSLYHGLKGALINPVDVLKHE